jgi:transcriptional regulator with XRE-family HTH domain
MFLKKDNKKLDDDRQLVLHIRKLRQWYGKRPLTQQELAEMADISGRQLRNYESARQLPRVVKALLSVAIAMKVPFEDLISPTVREKLSAEIQQRRQNLGLSNGNPPERYVRR